MNKGHSNGSEEDEHAYHVKALLYFTRGASLHVKRKATLETSTCVNWKAPCALKKASTQDQEDKGMLNMLLDLQVYKSAGRTPTKGNTLRNT